MADYCVFLGTVLCDHTVAFLHMSGFAEPGVAVAPSPGRGSGVVTSRRLGKGRLIASAKTPTAYVLDPVSRPSHDDRSALNKKGGNHLCPLTLSHIYYAGARRR